MRRLVSLLAAAVALASCGSSGTPHAVTPPHGAGRSVRDQLVDAFVQPLWGNARTVRYSIDQPPWGTIEGEADLTAQRFALTFAGGSGTTDPPRDAYVEGTRYWERTESGDAWLSMDLRIDQPPFVTPQIPLFVPQEEPPQPSYITDARIRREVVDAWLVSMTKLDTVQVHGVSATGYRVHLSAAAPSHPLPAELSKELALYDADNVDETIYVWIDDAGAVRKLIMPGIESAQNWTIELWDQNAPVTITRPNDLDRRPSDQPPTPDPAGTTDVDVTTGPRLGRPNGDRRTFTGDTHGAKIEARIIQMGDNARQLEVTASVPTGNGDTAYWTITVADAGDVRTGVYPIGDNFDWTPEQPVGGVGGKEVLITKECTGHVDVSELTFDARGRPERVSLTFAAKCPTDGNDAGRQSARVVSGHIHIHALTP